MKNKKIPLIILGVLVGIICVIIITKISIIGVSVLEEASEEPSIEEKQKAIKENQISFLKEHEKELTGFVSKTENIKVTEVAYEWNDLKEETIGNGLPNGDGKVIQIFGFVNKNKSLDFRLDIQLDDTNMPVLSTLQYGQMLSKEGE